MSEHLYVVDRIEGDVVVLVPDDAPHETVEVGGAELPPEVEEGMVLRAAADEASRDHRAPDWSLAVLDLEETARRRDDAAGRIERLRKRDPGGDVVL